MARSGARGGLTLVELVIGMVVGAILGAASLAVIQRGVHSAVYLPHELRASQVGTEVLEAITEGNRTTLATRPGQWLPGLRYAQQLLVANTARIDYELPTGERVLLWNIFNFMIRLVFGESFEFLPSYYADSAERVVRIQPRIWPDTGETATFRYYDGAGNRLPASPTLSQVRRIEVGLLLETGSGEFEEAAARLELVSAVAPRALQ